MSAPRRVAALLSALAVVLTACQAGSTAAPTAATAAPTTASAKPGAAAGPTSGCPDQPGAAGAKVLKVGLVTDVGKVDDKSFNQSAWEGVQKAKTDLGAEVKFIETTDPKDYGKNIEQFAQEDYTVIVTVGFALGQATDDLAKKYPNVKFI